ncbi:MAG: right-handed parallel beta-helix repeat-containing protein [Ardenticatenales bacterium]
MAWLHRRFTNTGKLATAVALCLFLASTVSSAVLAATPIYVRTDGDDSACNGTVDAGVGSAPNCAVKTIQKGIDIVDSGGTVHVGAGTYIGDVNANKPVTLLGAGSGSTTIKGPLAAPAGTTLTVNALNVVIDGFTITREGNAPATWNDPGINSAGIAIQSAGKSMEVRNTVLTGNRTGIDINDNSGVYIHNSDISFNRTGLILRNVTDAVVIEETKITDNWTAGILFLDASGGTNVPAQTALNATIRGNNISGNWYGGIVDRQSGGSLPLPGTTNLKNFSGNWLGTTTPVVTTANTSEPGYSAQIPVAYGGSAVPPGGAPDIAGPASANVDFTPWLASSTDTDGGTFGFQGDFSTLWVDDAGAQTGVKGRVQEGVDEASAAGTVRLAAGTYEEQVEITAARTLQGVGQTSIIKAPTTLTKFFLTGADQNRPVVYIHGTNGVVVKDLKVDGAGRGNANSRFVGVGFNNAGGTVQDTEIVDVRNQPFDGSQHGVSIYAYNSDTTSRTITLTNNTLTGFQKNGVALNTNATTPLVVSITGNTVTGAGTTSVTAQNGIQVFSDLGSGTVAGNTISGIAYSGSGTVASSILNYYAELTIDDNVITGAQTGIYNYDGGANLTNNEISVAEVGDYSWGIIASDPPRAVPQPFDGTYLGEGGGGGANTAAAASTNGTLSVLAPQALLTVAVTGNRIVFTGVDNADSFGIEADAGYGADDMAVNIDNNTIYGFDVGVVWWTCDSGCSAGVYTAMSATGNCIDGNDEGMTSNVTSPIVNAENNWWGAVSGPYNATSNPGGIGNSVSDNIDFMPWATVGCSLSDTWLNTRSGELGSLADLLSTAQYGDTLRAVGGEPLSGGTTVTTAGVTLDLNGNTGGPGSPFLTVAAADVTVTNGILDGGGSGSPAILVVAGGNNFTLSDCEVKNWADGVEVAASVTSFKMFGNWIHNNADAGLQVDGSVAFGGVVTIEGNLFKDNGGNGIKNLGTTIPLTAKRNSWGDVAGPTGLNGDTASAGVDFTPFTFAELHLDMDPVTVGDQTLVNVSEGTTFNTSLKLDAQKVNSIQFKITYDAAYLTLNSTTFLAPWLGQCFDNGSVSGVLKQYCILFGGEYDGGTLATLNFTAANPPPGPGPWPTNLDIAHLEADTAASALGGAKIFLNNAGYNAPSVASRDITDTNDGTVNIIGKANYNGFIDLQGRTNDSGGKLRVFDIVTKAGSTELAQGTSASSGSYATAHNVGFQLMVGSTYYLLADRDLFVATTAEVSTTYSHSKLLDTRPFTTLVTLVLRGGDAYNDNMIDIGDASCIGSFYGTMSSACGGGSPVGSSPDVNEDGIVNILDLSLMGGNYLITSSTWAP